MFNYDVNNYHIVTIVLKDASLKTGTHLGPETYGKSKAIPVQVYYRPIGFQEVDAPRILHNRHMKVIKLSALRTGRLYAPGNIPGTHFLLEAESTPGPQSEGLCQ